jgi:hypothetical protein
MGSPGFSFPGAAGGGGGAGSGGGGGGRAELQQRHRPGLLLVGQELRVMWGESCERVAEKKRGEE